MARQQVRVTSSRPPEEVFDLLADMRNAPTWDPSVVSAAKVSPGPVAVGTRFEVAVRVAGRAATFTYCVGTYHRPRLVVLEANHVAVRSRDEITVEPLETGGCEVVYDAELTARSVFRLAAPVIDRSFEKIVDEARAGLAARLAP